MRRTCSAVTRVVNTLEGPRAVRLPLLAALSFLSGLALPAGAQILTATLTAGIRPHAVTVNSVTNKIYVSNFGNSRLAEAGSITVIDGATNSTTSITYPGASPFQAAANPTSNKIYVTNFGPNIAVIDGATNSVSTISITNCTGSGIAVNPVTNKVYVACENGVAVIDASTNSVISIPDSNVPVAVAVNPVTNKIYAADNTFSGSVLVIDGATNSATTVSTPSGVFPIAVAVNAVTNKIYVANENSNNVTVLDGATNSISTVTVGSQPQNVAVNPVTDRIYVANEGSTFVTVIDGASNSTSNVVTNPTSGAPLIVAVDTTNDKIYVDSGQSDIITIIDGATNSTSTVTLPSGSGPNCVGVNPVTNKIYTGNLGPGSGPNGTISVIDGASNSAALVTDPNAVQPDVVAVNQATNLIYVGNNGSSNVSVINGATGSITATVNTGIPGDIAVNPITDKIYVSNFSLPGNVTVIDGATNLTTAVTDPNASEPAAVAVNPVTNKIYVANFNSKNVTVIDGATNSTSTVPAGTNPRSIAVNTITNKIYVANNGSGNVTVIDGATNNTATVPAGSGPFFVVVNPVTNKIYVTNFSSNNVTVIDGASNSTTAVPVGTNPEFVAVNPYTNKVYVSNFNGDSVTVIDGATNGTTTIPSPTAFALPQTIAVNAATNKIYVANQGGQYVMVIDGLTNSTVTVTTDRSPSAVAANPGTGKIYVANADGNDVTIITEQQVANIPLQVSITPLSNNQTSTLSPRFNFTARSIFSPNVTPIDNVLFQVDTWQGFWLAAANQGGGNFSGALSGLQQGVHILYAYATDSQEAASTNTGAPIGGASSPLISNIQAYVFLIAPPNITELSPSSGPVGTSVVISGNGFGSSQMGSTVTFNGVDAGLAAHWGETQITVNVPPAATTGPVVVTINGTPTNGVLFTVTAADLIESVVGNPPSTGVLGASFTVKDTTTNQGSATAGSSVTRYYLSSTSTKTSTSKLLNGSRSVSSLAPSASSTGTATVRIPSMQSGTYFLLACANDTRTASESNFTNNCIASTSTMLVSAPDLIETTITNPPASASRGTSFSVTDTTHNQGNATAGVSVTRYYLSLTTSRTSSSTRLTGSRSVPSLVAGGSSRGKVTVTIPSTTNVGTYFLLACSNDTRTVVESNYTNNCLASATTVAVH